MHRKYVAYGIVLVFSTILFTRGLTVAGPDTDFGLMVEHLLTTFAATLFGIQEPLQESAHGPFTGADNTQALEVANGLGISVVSNVTDPEADMIALWPNDAAPTHLFVCVENSFDGDSNPDVISVQRVDLSGNPEDNVQTVVKGLSSCDPIHRTPWGTLIVGEDAGETGGFYEILDPLAISGANPISVDSRLAGTTSDPQQMVKRKAVGSLSFEGIVILEDDTTYFGDELRPSNGGAGGAIYKFVPDHPYDLNDGVITDPALSPFASGTIYGMRLGTRNDDTDYGQGSEIGKGIWIQIEPAKFADPDGNIILHQAQLALGLTGYYRPEDMDRDPIAAAQGIERVCWTSTGNMTNGAASAVETAANYGELLCLEDEPDNSAFQPQTGRLIVLEDGPVEVLNADGSLRELRGNDIWMCLPDGDDNDVLSDGCIRTASLRDTASEPTGLIFDASGERAFVNLQHRATGQGAVLMITGFKVVK